VRNFSRHVFNMGNSGPLIVAAALIVGLLGWGTGILWNDWSDANARNNAVAVRAAEAQTLTGGLAKVDPNSYEWHDSSSGLGTMRVKIRLGVCSDVPGLFFVPKHPASTDRVSHLYVVQDYSTTSLLAAATDATKFSRSVAISQFAHCLTGR
jgi:hypothetical protein